MAKAEWNDDPVKAADLKRSRQERIKAWDKARARLEKAKELETEKKEIARTVKSIENGGLSLRRPVSIRKAIIKPD